MSAQLIREQLSKRNLKVPTALEQITSSRANSSSGSVNGKTRGKRSSGADLKRPVNTSTQGSDRLVNGHSVKGHLHEVSIAHQNTCVRASDVVQGYDQQSSKAPTIDENLISDGDEGLPFISAVYSLASPETGSQTSDRQVTERPTDKPDAAKMASRACATLMSIEKLTNNCDSIKDVSGKAAFVAAPRKPIQSPSKASLVSNTNDALSRHVNALPVMTSVLGNAPTVNLSSPDSRHVKISSGSAIIVTTPQVTVSELSSLPRNVIAVNRSAKPVVSVALQPTVTAPHLPSPRGTGTGYNLRKSSAASTQASSEISLEFRVATGTVTPTSGDSHTSDSVTVTQAGTFSQSASPVNVPAEVKLTETNTVAASTQHAIMTINAPKSSTAAISPVLISPNYRPTGARTDKAGQLIMISGPQKTSACAMTSLVQLVKSGTSSVTPGASVSLKAPQVKATKGSSLPVLVPATRPQQVVYKIPGPVSATAAGLPRSLPSQPLVLTGNSVSGSQGQTLIQILTPDGPMLLVPVSKPNPGATPTRLVQIPVKGNCLSPVPVQIVKTAINTTRTSVPIAPHPGIAGGTYSVILSANSPTGSQNASSRVSGLVNGGGKPIHGVSTTPAVRTVTTSVVKPPLVSQQVNSASSASSRVSSTAHSQSHSSSVYVSKDLSTSAQAPVVSASSNTSSSVSVGPSPQEARIQRLKELLRVQEQAVDRLRTKRQREMETVRESTIIGRSNADTDSAVESEDGTKTEMNSFALPLPPKKMKLDVPQAKAGGKNEIVKKKAEGFLPNGDDSQFVQLVGLESIVEKLKRKKREEAEARVGGDVVK